MIRVMLADDHRLFADGLAEALMAIPDIRVVGSAASGQELLDKLRNQPADVVLMDLEMPGLDGLGAIRQLPPNQRCIVVSMHDTDQAREQAC